MNELCGECFDRDDVHLTCDLEAGHYPSTSHEACADVIWQGDPTVYDDDGNPVEWEQVASKAKHVWDS